jgi:hypothetical protein
MYNCWWSSPAQIFSGPSPAGLMTIFYSLRFETPRKWRARSPFLYPPGIGLPRYTPRHWVLFPSQSYVWGIRHRLETIFHDIALYEYFYSSYSSSYATILWHKWELMKQACTSTHKQTYITALLHRVNKEWKDTSAFSSYSSVNILNRGTVIRYK